MPFKEMSLGGGVRQLVEGALEAQCPTRQGVYLRGYRSGDRGRSDDTSMLVELEFTDTRRGAERNNFGVGVDGGSVGIRGNNMEGGDGINGISGGSVLRRRGLRCVRH